MHGTFLRTLSESSLIFIASHWSPCLEHSVYYRPIALLLLIRLNSSSRSYTCWNTFKILPHGNCQWTTCLLCRLLSGLAPRTASRYSSFSSRILWRLSPPRRLKLYEKPKPTRAPRAVDGTENEQNTVQNLGYFRANLRYFRREILVILPPSAQYYCHWVRVKFLLSTQIQNTNTK